jgi:crotonobetaine/carnitine-CoA ligase
MADQAVDMAGPSAISVLRLYADHGYSLDGVVASRAARRRGAPAIEIADRTIAWDELPILVGRMAAMLSRRGVARGDRVAIAAANSEFHVLVLIALGRLGAIMVPINPAFGPDEVRYVLDKAGVSGVFCDTAAADAVGYAADGAKTKPWLLPLEDDAAGGQSLQSLLASEREIAPSVGLPDDPCIIIFTSGTTGFPKGATHSQRTLILSAEAFVERLRLNPDDRVLVLLPLFHINALFYSATGSLVAGAGMVIVPKFSASGFWDLAVRSSATTVNVIEAVGTILASRPRTEFRPEHRISKVFGVRDSFAQPFRQDFGISHLISGYGMSEIPGTIATPFDALPRRGSMGLPGRHPDHDRPWTQCRVVDEAGNDVGPLDTGELVVRSPALMLGYYRDERLTHEAFRDGWFRTGDLVRRDEDGWFYFVGRARDIIRRRGENISGAEIDRILEEHPAIAAAATIGVPSELGEEDILSVVVRQPDAVLDAEAVVAWCRTRLAAMKAPRYVLFAEELPLTATHKIAKQVLRADTGLKARATDMHAIERSEP